MTLTTDKWQHLRGCFSALSADDPATLLAALTAPPRPVFRFEYQQKARMLAFLTEHYAAWRSFDTAEADRIAALTIPEAQGDRALSEVIALGKAWWATGDPHYGSAFERFYLSVPTGAMFNWGSFNGTQGSLELDAFFLLLDCDGFSTEGRIAFLDHLYAISEFAWDHETSCWNQLMLGPEGHNWYLHGMHVLPFLGLLFPEFTRAAELLRNGWSMVEEHVRGHLHQDGGARETTLGYQAGSMENLWDFYLIALRNGYPISAGFADRLLAGTRFLLKLQSPQGGLPSFGDGGHAPGGLTTLAAIATALTGDRECKWYAEYGRQFLPATPGETPGEIPQSAFWAVGLAGARMYAETRPLAPRTGSQLLSATGYAAMRTAHAPTANYLAIAAAPRGPIVTSHGHNDIFALDVQANGVRFLGEMGCAPYGESEGRDYDQRTAAHNCLVVNGQEQVPLLSEWRWSGRNRPAIRRWISEDTHDFFHGVHEGYYQYPTPLTLHARKVFFVKSAPSYWLVFDWLESNVEVDCDVYFHGCLPGTLRDSTILLGAEGGMRLAVTPPEGRHVTARVVEDPGLTAYCREKGIDPVDYPCFAYHTRATNDCLVWALLPQAAGAPLPRVTQLPVTLNGVTRASYDATAIRVEFPDCTDTICLSHKDYDAMLCWDASPVWGFLAFQRHDAAGNCLLNVTHTMTDGCSEP